MVFLAVHHRIQPDLPGPACARDDRHAETSVHLSEPAMVRCAEFYLHGWLHPDGDFRLAARLSHLAMWPAREAGRNGPMGRLHAGMGDQDITATAKEFRRPAAGYGPSRLVGYETTRA